MPADGSIVLFAGSALVDATMAGWLGARLGRGRSVARWGALAMAVWIAKVALLVGLGMDPFLGQLHVLWLDVVLALPAFGGGLLVTASGRASRAVAVACLALLPVGLWGTFVGPGRLLLERATVPLPPARAGDAPISVGVLADLQFARVGDHEREAVARIMALRPDVIVLPGDVHQGSDALLGEQLPAIRALLGGLRAPGGVWMVRGDQEDGMEAALVTAGTRVTVLEDEARRVAVGNRRLTVAGLGLDFATNTTPAGRALLARLERAPAAGDVRLVIAHRPDAALALPRGTRVDLLVAGHTHGGQVALPFLGPIEDLSAVPRKVGAGGLHDLGGGRLIYVSRGVGLERGQAPRVRIGVPPEISLLTLGDRGARPGPRG